MSRDQYLELVRAAAVEASNDHVFGDMVRASLYDLVADNDEAREIFEEETGPEQVTLQLRLTEGTVEGHSAPASEVTSFMTSIAKAAGAIAKQVAGRQRYPNRILLEGVAPGSLIVTLKAPKVEGNGTSQTVADVPIPGATPSNPESSALRKLAGILNAAVMHESDPDLASLDAAVFSLPPSARARLKTATTIAEKAKWNVGGEVAQRHHRVERFQLSPTSAAHLSAALAAKEAEPVRRIVNGSIDGYKYTLSTMYFKEAGDKRSLAVVVPEESLMLEVARLAVDPGQEVRAGIDFIERSNSEGNLVTSRVLTSIELLS